MPPGTWRFAPVCVRGRRPAWRSWPRVRLTRRSGSSARLDPQFARRAQPASRAEPLTDRELAVLRLLRGPLRLGEIARQMDLSGNTVKTHTRAIYRKLGVSSRREAVARARAAGLI
jgi:DNA-binding CsgD family transcriptional regulator